jgi:transcriptional regulator with XRE-family HTH domain
MTNESVDRQRLASILRALRIDATLSTTELARQLNWSQSKVSKTERGETLPRPEDVELWARQTRATPQVRAELAELADRTSTEAVEWRRELAPGRRRKQEEIQRLEANASVTRVFAPSVVVGLAQTRQYAEAMFRLGREVAAVEPLGEIVTARLERQRTLDDQTQRFKFVMGEFALRRQLIPGADMREQVGRLIDLSHRPNVDIGVITVDAAETVHQYHGFAIIGDPLQDAESIVLAETLTRALRIRSTEEIVEYVEHFDALRAAAISGDQLRSFLREVIENLHS